MLRFGVSKCYLLSLCYAIMATRIAEVPIFFLPGTIIRWRVLDPMMRATQGTIEACIMALDRGWSINLGGGYHHCSKQGGGGFCFYPDISLATEVLLKYFAKSIKKVMIVDLDAH